MTVQISSLPFHFHLQAAPWGPHTQPRVQPATCQASYLAGGETEALTSKVTCPGTPSHHPSWGHSFRRRVSPDIKPRLLGVITTFSVVPFTNIQIWRRYKRNREGEKKKTLNRATEVRPRRVRDGEGKKRRKEKKKDEQVGIQMPWRSEEKLRRKIQKKQRYQEGERWWMARTELMRARNASWRNVDFI